MSYLVLCVLVLAVAGVVAAVGWRRAPRGHAGALALSAAALIVLTAIFDTAMIGAGLFDYAEAHLAGHRIGLAPIEDFAYPVAALLLASAVWNLLVPARVATSELAASRPEASARGASDRAASASQTGDGDDR